jgi:hypothetical protein
LNAACSHRHARRAQRADFGVRGGIVRRDRLIASAANHGAVADDQSPYRHLTHLGGCVRQGERLAHERSVDLSV